MRLEDALPDLLLHGGRIYPSPDAHPVSALLIRGGKVAAVGELARVRAVAAPAVRTIHLSGATVTAGFTDAHVHLSSWGIVRKRVSLAAARSVEEAVELVRTVSGRGEGWVRGHGWSRQLLGRWPGASDLDAAFPDRPVFLDSSDLHSAWVNGAALRLSGIGRDTPDPPGGRIQRDPASGEPTGVLLENARAAVLDRIPQPSPARLREALIEAQTELHRLGITGVHSVEADGLRDFGDLAATDHLRLRVLQHIQLAQLEGAIAVGLRSGTGGGLLRIGGVKMFLDGSLGSRTAWMREPYVGTAGERGIQALSRSAFREAVERASGNGLASTVHAIGDAAVEMALEVLESVPPPPALPHRIEHVQLCPPDLWGRAGGSGIVGSVQPTHLLTDRAAAEEHWGHDRCRGAYPLGRLRSAGMVLAFGSDAPVEEPDPRPALFAATQRGGWNEFRSASGPVDPWYPEHALSASQAVAAYTEGPAVAAGRADRQGRLIPGAEADLAGWNVDPVRGSPADFRRMKCLLTMVAGEVVYQEIP